ncbi:DUF2505 domain-containing protein [Mycobacterium sp. NPDC003449]
MGRRMEHAIAFDAPCESMYAVFARRDYWQTMLEHFREVAPQSELTGFRSGADGIDVTFRQVLPGSDLPAIVRSVIPLDMAITREQHLDPYDPGRDEAMGHYTATVAHAPGRLDGRYRLTATGTGSQLQFTSSCKVPVPLLGGKLEGMVLQFMKEVLVAEEAFTADWIAQHQ